MTPAQIGRVVAVCAPDHAAHVQELLRTTTDVVDVGCSCGVGLTFTALQVSAALSPGATETLADTLDKAMISTSAKGTRRGS